MNKIFKALLSRLNPREAVRAILLMITTGAGYLFVRDITTEEGILLEAPVEEHTTESEDISNEE